MPAGYDNVGVLPDNFGYSLGMSPASECHG
jgi:hypothetical protein